MGKMFSLGLSIPKPDLVIGHPYLYDIIFLFQTKFRVRLIIKVDSNEDQSLLIMTNIYNKEKEKRKRKRKSNTRYGYFKVASNEDQILKKIKEKENAIQFMGAFKVTSNEDQVL